VEEPLATAIFVSQIEKIRKNTRKIHLKRRVKSKVSVAMDGVAGMQRRLRRINRMVFKVAMHAAFHSRRCSSSMS
jgi:hypothetical protein